MKKTLIFFTIVTLTIFAYSVLISAQIYKDIEFQLSISAYESEANAGGTAKINMNPKNKINISIKVYGLIPETNYEVRSFGIYEPFTTNKSGSANIHFSTEFLSDYLIIINAEEPTHNVLVADDIF